MKTEYISSGAHIRLNYDLYLDQGPNCRRRALIGLVGHRLDPRPGVDGATWWTIHSIWTGSYEKRTIPPFKNQCSIIFWKENE